MASYSAHEFIDGTLKPVEIVSGTTHLLAGGFIRDRLHDKPVGDIDIFVLVPPTHWHGLVENGVVLCVWPTLGQWGVIRQMSYAALPSDIQLKPGGSFMVGDFISYTCDDVPELNLIIVKDKWNGVVEDFLDTFSLNISKIAINLMSEDVIAHPDFVAGSNDNRLVFQDATDKYFDKIAEKYYDWPVSHKLSSDPYIAPF